VKTVVLHQLFTILARAELEVRTAPSAGLTREVSTKVFERFRREASAIGGDLAESLGSVRQAIATVDPGLPIFALQTAEERLAHSLAPRRFNMLSLVLFAVSAFTLAAFGLYAVTTHLAGQCSPEFKRLRRLPR
jgi:hypothetical protein